MRIRCGQELVGDSIRSAYLTRAPKKQRAALVAPLWEAARSAFIGTAAPVTAAAVNGGVTEPTILTEEAVNQALKVQHTSSHVASLTNFDCGILALVLPSDREWFQSLACLHWLKLFNAIWDGSICSGSSRN